MQGHKLDRIRDWLSLIFKLLGSAFVVGLLLFFVNSWREAHQLRPQLAYGFTISYHPRWEDPRDKENRLLEATKWIRQPPPEAWPPPEDVNLRVFLWAVWRNLNTHEDSCGQLTIEESLDLDFESLVAQVSAEHPSEIHPIEYHLPIEVTDRLCGKTRLALPVAWIDWSASVDDPVNAIRSELGEPKLDCKVKLYGPLDQFSLFASTDILDCGEDGGFEHPADF